MSGTATPNLPLSNGVDDVVGNSGGNTVRVALSRLAALLSYLQGPAYKTSAELFADKAWPDGAIGQVYGDTAGQNGTYRKSGAAGTGSWTRTGDLAVSPLTVAQLADKADLSLVNELMTEVRSGRVYAPHAATVSAMTPPAGTARLLTSAGASVQYWVTANAPADGVATDALQADATGQWWRRVFDGRDLTAEISNRMAAIGDAGVMPLVNVQGKNVITAELTPVMKAGGATIAGASTVELIPVETSDGPVALNVDGSGSVPVKDAAGDDLHVGALVASRSYFLRRRGATWRIIMGGVTSVELRAEALARTILGAAIDENARNAFTDHVGDEAIVFADRAGAVGAYWSDGRLVAEIESAQHRHVGDTAFQWLSDRQGRALAYVEDTGEIMMPALIPMPDHVGDPITLIGDAAKRPLLWWDGQRVDGNLAGGGQTAGATISRPIPATNGNAWQVIDDGTSVRYLSDQYEGRVIGFEERGGLTLAETGPIAVGMLAFGGNMGVSRDVPEAWLFHNRKPDLSFDGGMLAAEAAAVAAQMLSRTRRSANPTVIHATRAIGSPVEADTEVGSTAYNGLLADLASGVASLAPWGKTLVIDRLMLSLLGGAPSTSEIATDVEYAAIAQELRADIVEITGQSQPVQAVVVSQSIGTRTDGRSTVALAEAKLDYLHPTIQFVVATPRHPFALEPGTAATLTRSAAAVVSEIEARAVAERAAGRQWYCPRLQSASRSGTTITAQFVAMSDLVLGATHGFSFDGDTAGAAITNVTVSGQTATITVDKAPSAEAQLCLAWGRVGDPGDGKAANRTTIRDQWSEPSLMVPGQTLYRHALSMRVAITTV